MANVLLGITGSVAAVKVPEMVDVFQARGHTVRLVATKAATYFFDAQKYRKQLTLDEDEWPGEGYKRGDTVRHIELRNWANLFCVAPLDANTLAKLANGLCDNALTCVWRAWDTQRPIVLAPAMNTLMWEHAFTVKHLRSLAQDFGVMEIPANTTAAGLIETINKNSSTLRIAAPVEKELACGDVGVGAMATPETILSLAESLLQ